MLTTMAGIMALERLRTQLEEDAGDAFPHDVLPKLLMLYDVCRCLDLSIFRIREVMGDTGWAFVRAELDAAAKAKGYDLGMLKETHQTP